MATCFCKIKSDALYHSSDHLYLKGCQSMEIYCEVCECNIWKCGWTKRVKTQKHRIACGDVVVEEV